MNGASIRKTLAGRWVNTIVRTSPIRLANRAAARNEIEVSRLAAKKMVPVAPAERSNFWKSQSAIIDCTASPLANESRLNNAASR